MGDINSLDVCCDDLPFPLTDTDREILATADEDYRRITWNDLKTIIANDTLADLKRLPSDLRRYLAWSCDIKKQYGSITTYVIQKHLTWTPLTTSPPAFDCVSKTPFAARSDYAVLLNDWPYGFVPGIVHLIVWSKTPLKTEGIRGQLTLENKCLIENFVEDYFTKVIGEHGRDHVLWFNNWVNASVAGVDHVHVLVKDVPNELLDEWTERKDL